MIKAVIFDFDGTLVPLTLDFAHLRKEIIMIARKYVSAPVIEALDHHYIIEMIHEISDSIDNGGAFTSEAFERLKQLELEACREKKPFPYTHGVLMRLQRNGLRIGIMTRSCTAVLEAVLPEIHTYADIIATREDLKLLKPHPAHVRRLLAKLGLQPDEALVVGDHPTDVTAGKDAGAVTAGVLSGRTSRLDFKRAGADYILEDIREVPEIIKNNR